MDYLTIISQANMTDNESEIRQVIKYIDGIIERDGEKSIFSIYYDKAKLLFKLKNYNEAMETLEKSKNSYDIQKAALLIYMGNDKEAKLILDNFLFELKKSSTVENITEKDIEILYIVSLLADINFDDICDEYIDFDYIDTDKLFMYKNNFIITKEELLRSMWPEVSTN